MRKGKNTAGLRQRLVNKPYVCKTNRDLLGPSLPGSRLIMTVFVIFLVFEV